MFGLLGGGPASDIPRTLLVNNAGVMGSFDVLTASAAALDADIRTNVHGTLAVIKAFVPVLRRVDHDAARRSSQP